MEDDLKEHRSVPAGGAPSLRESLLRLRLHAMGRSTSAHGSPRVRESVLHLRLNAALFTALVSNLLFVVYVLILILK